jgi:glycosyltransferase involved in cell wall biosynthesis
MPFSALRRFRPGSLRRAARRARGSRLRINLAYAVPPASRKAAQWHDGFTAAVDRLGREFDVAWLNLHPDDLSCAERLRRLDDCDCLLVKSNWGWIVDELVRGHSRRRGPPRGLLISGTADPPRPRRMRFYDAVFFETHWYAPRIERHPRRIHAFGVDTTVMRPHPKVERDIDWLSVGAFRPYKRHEVLLGKEGRRVAIGDLSGADPDIVARLERGGVQVLDFMGYEELARHYRRARAVLVAASLQGGGERSVLEARACGATVHVLDDNPKLRELLREPAVWDHEYYARQLAKGIEILCGAGA